MMDRRSLVRRHNPHAYTWDPESPLSLGNGNFVFTADFTGLQTCADTKRISIPRCTMSIWGFHSYADAPSNADKLRLETFTCSDGRTVGYMSDPTNQEALYHRLRVNPHRFHLGNIGLEFASLKRGSSSSLPLDTDILTQITRMEQSLDMYTGLLTSNFTYRTKKVEVLTAVHPDMDALSIRVHSPLLHEGALGVSIQFPYGSHDISGADWDGEELHYSHLVPDGDSRFVIKRTMDDIDYSCILECFSDNRIQCSHQGPHAWNFTTSNETLELTILFTKRSVVEPLPSFEATQATCAAHWKEFWHTGAAVSFEGSRDGRAIELERRVVLSQYLLAIQSLGSLPPAETGLTCNSWYGKFHLEMHPWHALHTVFWGRPALMERSLAWYETIRSGARERAKSQGYRGARWPKMTDPSGKDSPSSIGTLLCWQQPHLLLFAEALYRVDGDKRVLQRYRELVEETVIFMVDYLQWDKGKKRYVLGPPLIPVQENHAPRDTLNPIFEIEYWRWALQIAVKWKERLKEIIPTKWIEVLNSLSPPPQDADSRRYRAHEHCNDTYGHYATDHPAVVLPYALIPGPSIDRTVMSRSIDAVLESWKRESLWGWDFAALAMTCARLGRPEDAVDMLLINSPKNTYRMNGHNAQIGHDALPLYLPGNGALLLAVGMMCAGWEGEDQPTPGFPRDETWTVTHEGFFRYF